MHLQTLRYDSAAGIWSAPFEELDSDQTLVLVFAAPSFMDAPGPIAALVDHFHKSHVVGCSSSGEIHGEQIYDESLSVAIVRFDDATVRHAEAKVEDADCSFGAGQALARQLADEDLRAVLILSEGIHVNGSELVRGLNDVLPPEVVVTGGLAGDGDRFERTWVLQGGQPTTCVISAVGLYGDSLRVGHGSRGGWDIFGPERLVTRSEGNVLYELDGRPALALYKEYLGERAEELPASGLLFPLSIRERGGDDRKVRTILGVDEEGQSLTFAGDMPEGYFAQLMCANFDRLVDGAADASLSTARMVGSPEQVLCIAISCVGRRLVMGERTEEEVEAALESLPEGVHQVGFYSYGEISPYASGRCDLHNQTMTLTAIAEG